MHTKSNMAAKMAAETPIMIKILDRGMKTVYVLLIVVGVGVCDNNQVCMDFSP